MTIAPPVPAPVIDSRLENLPDVELVEHLLTRYHDVHREQLPELIRLAQRVERVHGGHLQCPDGLSAHLEFLLEELEAHMRKEEQILFPLICRRVYEGAAYPVMIMRDEHEDHFAALDKLDRITHGLQLPGDACGTWHKLYEGLQVLKADLQEHIRLENEVLFARVDGGVGR